MRKVFIILMQAILIPIMAQNPIENYTYVSNVSVPQKYGLPTVRSVGGGTKFIVSYEGNWSNDMQGAFEYACKIWEEAMPTTFPIHIKAILDESNDITALSKVSSETKIHDFKTEKFDYHPITGRSTWLQMKGTKFVEYLDQYDTKTYDNVLTLDMFNEPDIIITYYNKNNKIKDNCSFSIGETIDDNKYDFVTLVLRDLAKSFGLSWQYNNPELWPSIFKEASLTPYEHYIRVGLYSDKLSMLEKATQGSLKIEGRFNLWDLYAPTKWDVQNSLSCFIPDPDRKVSKLLSHNFGKGSIIRDIDDRYTYKIFQDLLNWCGDIAVGFYGQKHCINELSQTTKNVIGYNGNINLGAKFSSQQTENNFVLKRKKQPLNSIDETNDSISKIIMKYYPLYNDIDDNPGTVSLLLNDGTWDIVYTYSRLYTRNISVSDFKMHKPNKDYARTTDGYLRCRISEGRTAAYYALDYLPQIAVMAKSMILTPENEEDYYRDVEIAYKNIEGTTKVVVLQYKENENIPIQHILQDIKSGKFIATVDREYSSTFIIASYNKNGVSMSENYVLPAITPVNELKLSFEKKGNEIKITSNSRRMNNKLLIKSYEIIPLNILMKSEFHNNISSNTIDISALDYGFYILNVLDIFGKRHSFKFVIR